MERAEKKMTEFSDNNEKPVDLINDENTSWSHLSQVVQKANQDQKDLEEKEKQRVIKEKNERELKETKKIKAEGDSGMDYLNAFG